MVDIKEKPASLMPQKRLILGLMRLFIKKPLSFSFSFSGKLMNEMHFKHGQRLQKHSGKTVPAICRKFLNVFSFFYYGYYPDKSQ